MIALMRKDQPWIAIFMAAGTVALTIALTSEGFHEVWLFPLRRAEGLYHVAWSAGVALGLFAASYDELLGTRDYLRHRPIAPWRLHASRVLGCVLVLIAWMLFPPILQWAGEAIFGELAPQGLPSRVLDVWACEVVAWSGCAVGLFAATLPCGHLLRVICGGAALLVLFDASWTIARVEQGRWHDAGLFVAIHFAAALWLGAVSFATARHDADPDRPWPAASRYVGAGTMAVALAAAATIGISFVQSVLTSIYQRNAPMLAEVDGEFRLVLRREQGNQTLLLPANREHQPEGEPIARERVGRTWSPRNSPALGYRDPRFEEPRFHVLESGWGRTMIDGNGVAYVVRFDPRTARRSFLITGKGPGRTPFARGAHALRVQRGREESSVDWVVEPGAAEVWRLARDDDHFTAVPLPGGDRVVAVSTLHPDRGAIEEQLAVGELRYRLETADVEGIVGERGTYSIQDGGPTVAPSWLVAESRSQGRGLFELLELDLLTPRVRAVDPTGAVRFEHAFAPRNGAERFHATMLLLVSSLRPLPLQLAAHRVEAVRPDFSLHSLWVDPLLANGRRPWLLLLTFGVALAAAFAAYYRLRRLGAPAGVRRFWVASCIALGPAGLLASTLIERRRAHAPAPVQQEPVPAPRIVSLEPS